ncbi:cysteine proteinase [Polychaeton citri CBS 116435]|uniref:Cysteine proteinase n=1 Tax=Polychaeton citri CBS 116435 TaxID=1314669 RepID=A0A9P4QEK8_9PEZI|nr:cysteine proteinase [Polychaeton citri CBS 116435]
MQALRLTQDSADKAKWSQKVQQLLEEAERIKRSPDWRAAITSSQIRPAPDLSGLLPRATKTRVLKEPRSTRELSRAEQILLLRASQLNGFKFPPWKDAPSNGEFEINDGEELFTDPVDLRLSKLQQKVFNGWKRPSEALPPPSWFPDSQAGLGPTMRFDRDIDLVQDAATDCSVVASLCAGVARGVRGHPRLLGDKLYPYSQVDNSPMMSNNGKYIMKLNFNGCYRKVVIDDRLPVSKTGRVIHVMDRHNPGLLWPALLEKAYLKVRGGYDFPGSNSGTDLWLITGWIPEQVFLQSDELEPDRLWRRIMEAFVWGDVLITMGTGKMSKRAERELGLAGEHDYAVLDLREIDGQRLFLIKNPWCEGTSWKGSRRPSNLSEHTPARSSRDLLNADSQLSPGTFWMDMDNVIQHFESIYLNWNPGLFAQRQDMHFPWDLSSCSGQPRGRYASLSGHPQFVVSSDKGGVIWVVLSRHFQNVTPADGRDLQPQDLDLTGYISLYAFQSRGLRALLAEKTIHKGPFVDSPQTLLKLEKCEPGVPYTITPAEQSLPDIKHVFTISAFSDTAIKLQEAQTKYPHVNTMSSCWTKDTAGGNAHSPTYSTNPQFSITVGHRTNISILLEALDDSLNVHVKLVHGKGSRVYAVRSRDIICDSKEYRRGCCLAEYTDLEQGRYTIICSTFESNQFGDFSLRVESTKPAQVQQLPREGAGRVRTELSPVFFRNGQSRAACPIAPQRLVKLYAIARLSENGMGLPAYNPQNTRRSPSNRSLVRMSIQLGRGPNRRALVTSSDGEYSDNAAGIRTEDIDLSPDLTKSVDVWLVLDRMYVAAGNQEERYNVEVFADQLNGLQFGSWREWED